MRARLFAARDSHELACWRQASVLELAERFGEPTPDGVTVELRLSQEELASWCSCSREATAKALRTLREVAGVTTGRRTVALRDPDLLRRHARLA